MELLYKHRIGFILLFTGSILLLSFGYLILKYIKQNKLDNLNKLLGVGLYWLQLFAYALFIFGIISTLFLIAALYVVLF